MRTGAGARDDARRDAGHDAPQTVSRGGGHEVPPEPMPVPLVWTFEGRFDVCLADLEDALRRALVLVGDVSRLVVRVELSLPALRQRVRAGDAVQPAWARFVARIGADYGLPEPPDVRHRRTAGPLATLVVAYRR